MGKGKADDTKSQRAAVPLDLHRAFVFPNRVREMRRERGYPKLLPLAAAIPEIPYIRLSKIERGEVFARADEIRRIGEALGVAPHDLLLDVDAPDFDIGEWAEPFAGDGDPDLDEERFAVLLGAALRARRASDGTLTIAAIERDYGLAPVNLSRLENALKPFARWNAPTHRALFALFDVADESALRAQIADQHRAGTLDPFLAAVVDPGARQARSRVRIASLRAELGEAAPLRTPPPPTAQSHQAASPVPDTAGHRLLAIRSGVLPGGVIADAAGADHIAAPEGAGERAFAVRLGRAVLGPGLPVGTVLVADPDRSPGPGGLALLREDAGWRLLAISSGRDGGVIGFALNPEHEVPLDDCDPARLATVVTAFLP
jgi:hypothetical protein